MTIFNKIFGNREEIEYKTILSKVSNPLMDKIDTIEEREVRDFFKTILDAAERSLRIILFMAPSELIFKIPSGERDKTFLEKTMKEKSAFYKLLTKEEIDFWLRKVFLALMSYSYYFYGDDPGIKENRDLANLSDLSNKLYWERMYRYYNQIFNENIGQKEIDYYAVGLKEDTEKGYSQSGEMKKVLELTTRDYKTIGAELLQKVWKEDVGSNEKKVIFLGVRIWQAYQQIVQPFLAKLLKEY